MKPSRFEQGQTAGQCDLIDLLYAFIRGDLPRKAFDLSRMPESVAVKFSRILDLLEKKK